MANKDLKKCWTSYIIKELQINTRYHYTPIIMAKTQNTENTKSGQDENSQNSHSLLLGMKNNTVILEYSLTIFILASGGR